MFEILSPYFDKLQFWHLVVGAGAIFLLAGWQMEKWKLDGETADLRAYDEAMKEIEKKNKTSQREK